MLCALLLWLMPKIINPHFGLYDWKYLLPSLITAVGCVTFVKLEYEPFSAVLNLRTVWCQPSICLEINVELEHVNDTSHQSWNNIPSGKSVNLFVFLISIFHSHNELDRLEIIIIIII